MQEVTDKIRHEPNSYVRRFVPTWARLIGAIQAQVDIAELIRRKPHKFIKILTK
jgi:hypothetical protein